MGHPSARAGFDPTLGSQLRVNGVPVVPVSALYADLTRDGATDVEATLGVVPEGATILGAILGVEEAFDPTGDATLDVGYGEDGNQLIEDENLKAGDPTRMFFASRVATLEANTTIKAKCTVADSNNTGGKIRVTVWYAVPWVDFGAGHPIDAHRSE